MSIAAIRALRHVLQYWKKGDTRTAFRQLVEAVRCVVSATTIGLAYRLTPSERGTDISLRPERSGQARVGPSEARHPL
jgi:hypothetical protein